MGVLAVNRYIQSLKSPEARKEAALQVLHVFPPMLYNSELNTCLNQVGSKKTNEWRVFHELLANDVFRSFIGCSFTEPMPTTCSNKWNQSINSCLSTSSVALPESQIKDITDSISQIKENLKK